MKIIDVKVTYVSHVVRLEESRQRVLYFLCDFRVYDEENTNIYIHIAVWRCCRPIPGSTSETDRHMAVRNLIEDILTVIDTEEMYKDKMLRTL